MVVPTEMSIDTRRGQRRRKNRRRQSVSSLLFSGIIDGAEFLVFFYGFASKQRKKEG